jgi:hypothetical protein
MATEQTPAPWRDRHVPVIHGLADKRSDTGRNFETRPLGAFWNLKPGANLKHRGLAFVPSTYSGHDAREHAVQRQRGMFVALVADVDKGNHSLEQIEDLVRVAANDSAYFIHSTASAVVGDMRWRIIIPLETPAPFSEWRDAQEALFDLARARGIELDGVTERAGQISFLPNVPATHDKTGEVLRDESGPLYYAASSSGVEAPGLRLDQGPIAEALANLRQRRAGDERLREQLRAQAQMRRASKPRDSEGGVIEAFNRSTSINDLLLRYGYEQSPHHSDDWRSPNQTSGSYATRVLRDKWVSLSGSDAAAGLGAPCDAGCFGDAFDLFVHWEHRGDRSAAWRQACDEQWRHRLPPGRGHPAGPPPLPEGDSGWTFPPEGPLEDIDPSDHEPPAPLALAEETLAYDDRRTAQRAANMEIGEGSNVVPTARMYTLDEMIEKFVFVKDGSQVAPLDCPQAVLALPDFRNAMAASKHWFEADGRKKSRPVATLWLEDQRRMEADALTFRAGRERMTRAPDSGKAALNLWVPIERPSPPSDWEDRSRAFTDHIDWLWGPDAGDFLDWLAHIEQRPEVLPHFGWVHISREHGKGRNWISSVLVRVWPGHVAASLDLVSILDGGFNGPMSRKLLAIVDEINEGGNTSYRHAQKLRQIVTEEHRTINPKYGRQRVEYNSCRWLMFSNHTGALPLTEDDRRFWIVSHEGRPREPAYYEHLYGRLNDHLFAASVAELLRRRDLSKFKPGARPPMTAAKAELVAFGRTEDEITLRDIADMWPVDLITALELNNLLEDGGPSRPATRHAMDRVGIRKVSGKVKVSSQGTQTAYAVRNFDAWSNADHSKRRDEIERVNAFEKRASIGRDYVEV